MGEKFSLSAPLVGLPLLPPSLHDVQQEQHSQNELSIQLDIF